MVEAEGERDWVAMEVEVRSTMAPVGVPSLPPDLPPPPPPPPTPLVPKAAFIAEVANCSTVDEEEVEELLKVEVEVEEATMGMTGEGERWCC